MATKKTSEAKPAKTSKSKKSSIVEFTEEDIRQRAYEIFLRRGDNSLHPDEDWHQAIKELFEEADKNEE